MSYFTEIRDMMREHGVEQINFLYHRNRPTIQKDGYTYEIMFITAPEPGVTKLQIEGIKVRPGYEHKIIYLEMDDTWRKSSWKHVKDIIERAIKKWEAGE